MGILETRGLCHDFGGLEVLTQVNLNIRDGERHAIIGPNGAGKTTLFNVITGTYTAKRGQVYFKGLDVTKTKPFKLTRMGLGRSFQITSTFQKQTAYENIRLSILSKQKIRYNILRRTDTLKRVADETDEILKQINLYDERHELTSNLSYGKQRSLELGMAIGTNPDLLMFDEPTAGMSKEETRATVQLILKLTEGKSMVIVEHDMDVVFKLADRITVLHHGQILATDKPNIIKSDQRVKSAYLGDTEV